MHSQITSIPNWIEDLTSLEILEIDIYSSPCSSLPDTIGQLTNLQSFSISSENITSLPDTMGNLTNLYLLKIDCRSV